MTEKCFDIGTIQAFLDGELRAEAVDKISHHVAACDSCALLLNEAEEESAFAFSALDQEFNNPLVPTQRLWTKINDSIESERKPIWQNAFAFIAKLKSNFSNQTVVAFATLLIVFGLFTSVLILRDDKVSDFAAVNTSSEQTKQNTSSPALKSATNQTVVDNPETFPAPAKIKNDSKLVDSRDNKSEFRPIKAVYNSRENNHLPSKTNLETPKTEIRNPTPKAEPRTASENIAGEASYVKTIAALTETVNSRKDEVLKPSARFAFEKDLAVVDDAIVKMKSEVKRNPKNEGAKQVLLASYQNKIDLLNSVTEKTELMASLK